jgi:hypothetical protein
MRFGSQWWMAALCLCGFWSPAPVAAAPAEPAEQVMVVDLAFDRFDPSLFRLGFQRVPEEGESGIWTDPTGEAPPVKLEAQRTVFDQTILWVDPETMGQAYAARTKRLAALTALLSQERQRASIREAADAAGAGRGIAFRRLVHAREAGKAQIAQLLADRDTGAGMIVQPQPVAMYAPYTGPVALSWDDRQILISVRVQRFRKVPGKHLSLRDLGPPIDLHYVGAPIPDDADPVDWWTANDGARLYAEVREGFRHLFEAALAPLPALSKLERDTPLAAVMVDGRVRRFPGVVVDVDETMTRLSLGKRQMVLVRAARTP